MNSSWTLSSWTRQCTCPNLSEHEFMNKFTNCSWIIHELLFMTQSRAKVDMHGELREIDLDFRLVLRGQRTYVNVYQHSHFPTKVILNGCFDSFWPYVSRILKISNEQLIISSWTQMKVHEQQSSLRVHELCSILSELEFMNKFMNCSWTSSWTDLVNSWAWEIGWKSCDRAKKAHAGKHGA